MLNYLKIIKDAFTFWVNSSIYLRIEIYNRPKLQRRKRHNEICQWQLREKPSNRVVEQLHTAGRLELRPNITPHLRTGNTVYNYTFLTIISHINFLQNTHNIQLGPVLIYKLCLSGYGLPIISGCEIFLTTIPILIRHLYIEMPPFLWCSPVRKKYGVFFCKFKV